MNISPKVKASAWTGLALTLLATLFAGITPGMLEGLGVWAGPVFIAIGLIGQAIAGYQKTDPLRDLGAAVAVGASPSYPKPEDIPEVSPLASFPLLAGAVAATPEELAQSFRKPEDADGKHEATS